MTICVLMPVYNEGPRVGETLRRLRALAPTLGGIEVVLVDDGSRTPLSTDVLPAPSSTFSIVLLRHLINLGQGAALETARQVALGRGPFEAYVTMDSDGQHRPEDIPALVAALHGGADVAFGNRFLGGSNVPAIRRAVLHVATLFERVVTGLALKDAHNGFRAFNGKALELCVITQGRMAHATEIKQRIAAGKRDNGITIAEVPVSIDYSTATLQKGQSSLGAFTILKDLVFRYLFGDSTP